MSINDKIEILRERLYATLNKTDASKEEILKISQDLDVLISNFYLTQIKT